MKYPRRFGSGPAPSFQPWTSGGFDFDSPASPGDSGVGGFGVGPDTDGPIGLKPIGVPLCSGGQHCPPAQSELTDSPTGQSHRRLVGVLEMMGDLK